MESHHPWQLFPGQLIHYAPDRLRRPAEFDCIVGFLLPDVGLETLLQISFCSPKK